MAENITAEQEVYEVDKLTLLDCKKIRLAKEESGFLTLDYEGRTYHKVNPTRLIPFYSKTTYISLSYENSEKEFREIGVIKDNMRGAIFVKADTTSGQKTICIRDWYQNFRMIGYDYLYVNDADGNKYFCPDIHKLDRKSRQVLEMYT